MGFKQIELVMPIDYDDALLISKIEKHTGLIDFSYQIELKSLDARNKRNLHWKMRVGVFSEELKEQAVEHNKLIIPSFKRNKRAVVIGSGPAGFFAAYVLQKAGFETTIIERGADVEKRSRLINKFEKDAEFSEIGNYCFGEGGAGTFSDGKLTSRTKNIHLEKQFVIDSYIDAGAPEEIAYLSNPHIGTNNLIKIVQNLRRKFIELGGTLHFETTLTNINISHNIARAIETNKGQFDCDYLFLAIGHSSFDTYRKLISLGFHFRNKPFAIGTRVEHLQEIINNAQWGRRQVKGLKAAEYKLTHNSDEYFPVYSFCMCPGGKVVQATPSANSSIVNGMSYYSRNSKWANSAIVAGFSISELLNRNVTPSEALDWLERLESKFYEIKHSYQLPANKISDFLSNRVSSILPDSSYAFELFPFNFSEVLDRKIINSLKIAMQNFCKKINGFSDGIMLGLESKTSSPIQAIREQQGKAAGFDNIFVIGEGSGHSGGIISSAVDGVKSASALANQ